MSTLTGPRGWKPGTICTRFADVAPSSYDGNARTVDCVISAGSPVRRFYGVETLRITPQAVNLGRMANGGVLLLDSHKRDGIFSALGRFTDIWFGDRALLGRIKFNVTPEGRGAEGMIARGEIAGLSAGYTVEKWEITDSDGNVIDPEVDRIRWDADDLNFEATRWELCEVSLTTVPADGSAMIRSLSSGIDRAAVFGDAIADIRARMQSRQRMHERQQLALGDLND